MTDILQDTERPSSPDRDASPDSPLAASLESTLQPALQGPNTPKSHGRLPQNLSRLTIAHLVTIIGTAVACLVVAGALALTLIVSWLQSAVSDSTQWAEAETHLDYVQELATEEFLAATLTLRSEGHYISAIEEYRHQINDQLDELMAAATAIAGDSLFREAGTTLYEANENLTNTGIAAFASLEAGNAGAVRDGAFELEWAFTMWRRAHGTFSEAMRAAQSTSLQNQSDRADLALIGLAALSALAVAVLAGASRLGRQARKREGQLQREASEEKELLQTIIDQLPESISWKDCDLRLLGHNAAMGQRFRAADINPAFNTRIGNGVVDDNLAARIAAVEDLEREVIASGEAIHGRQVVLQYPAGESQTILQTVIPLRHRETMVGIVSTAQNISEIIELERSLAAAGRLESIGLLASGVAHEINTPVQFVSDNNAFLDNSFAALLDAVNSLAELAGVSDPGAVSKIKEQADLGFLLEDIPDAVSQSRDGLEQIAHIVRAMKDFAHPGGDVGPANINRLINSTVDVSRNEWKYDAEMELHLDEDLPQPHCDAGQIKQVLLNMVVNAAHAIADSDRDTGTITVTTSSTAETVSIQISDTGTGMTDEVKERIFERFFTTKEVGRGSGQGLAIAYNAINAHGGTIAVDSVFGEGTTFTIEMPIQPAATG